MRLAVILALASVAACSPKSQAPDGCTDAAPGAISVREVWMRPAGEGQPTSALYAVICNRTGSPEALLSVAVDGVTTVELHQTTRTADGESRMTKIDRLDIPPGGGVLAPGGAHVMLIGLEGAIVEGTEKAATFAFEKAPAVRASAAVQRQEGSSEHEHSH